MWNPIALIAKKICSLIFFIYFNVVIKYIWSALKSVYLIIKCMKLFSANYIKSKDFKKNYYIMLDIDWNILNISLLCLL